MISPGIPVQSLCLCPGACYAHEQKKLPLELTSDDLSLNEARTGIYVPVTCVHNASDQLITVHSPWCSMAPEVCACSDGSKVARSSSECMNPFEVEWTKVAWLSSVNSFIPTSLGGSYFAFLEWVILQIIHHVSQSTHSSTHKYLHQLIRNLPVYHNDDDNDDNNQH